MNLKAIIRLHFILQVLSAEIIAGAIISYWAISAFFRCPGIPAITPVLAICIWIVYAGDRVLDNTNKNIPTKRHHFYRRFKVPILVISVVLALLAGLCLFQIPSHILWIGTALTLLISLYFLLLLYFKIWYKELFAAVLYSSGVLLAPLSSLPHSFHFFHLIFALQFFAIVMVNLLIFSWYDRENDQVSRQISIILYLGEHTSRILIYALLYISFTVVLVSMAWYPETNNKVMQFCLFLMNAMLFLIFKFQKFFHKNEIYRSIGDGIFVLPVIYLIYERVSGI